MEPRKRGPKPTGKGASLHVRIQPAELAALDAAIADEKDAPSRPEMIQRIFVAHLKRRGHMQAEPGES